MKLSRLLEILILFGWGIIDSLSIHRVIFLLVLSPKLQYLIGQSVLFNGVIFLSSTLFIDYCLNYLLLVEEMETIILCFIYVFWVYPIYCISLILCTYWNKDIANITYVFIRTNQSNSSKSLKSICLSIVEDIYNILILSTYFIQVILVNKIPYIGPFVSVIQLSWAYSFTSFDYKWSLEGISLINKFYLCENNWEYMSGFGIVPAIITVWTSKYVGISLLALLSPLFIMTSMVAKNNKYSTYNYMPIFGAVRYFNCILVKILNKKKIN